MQQPIKPTGKLNLSDYYKQATTGNTIGSGVTPNQFSAPSNRNSVFENEVGLTIHPELIQDTFQSTGSNMANSLFNSIDEINKETYKGRMRKYDSQIEKLETEIYELNHLSTDPKAKGIAAQKEQELEKVRNNPDYLELQEDYELQNKDIEDSPVDKDYQLESQQSQMEENTNWYKFLTQEAPSELGGTLSEMGMQAGAIGLNMANQFAKKKLKEFILKRAAVAAGGAVESGGIVPLAMAALTATELTAEAVSMYKMRDAESEAEKAGAFDQRVQYLLEQPENQNIDPSTEEGRYRLNKVKQEAQEGLDQVYGQNMAQMIGDATGLVALMLPTTGIVGRLGKFGRGIEKGIRSTTTGRIGSVVGGAYLSHKLEGIEEGSQTGITAQYIAGKYRDNPSLIDVAGEAKDLFSDNAKYSFFGDTPNEYQQTAEYRNAVRSGEILGGAFAGTAGLAKITSDAFGMKAAQKEVEGLTPQILDQAKDKYRSNLYTKYFGSDKEEFLFNAINNTIKTSKNPELVAGAKVELTKAKEAQKLYYNLKDTHENYLTDDNVNKVFNNAQYTSANIEENDRAKNLYDSEYIDKIGEQSKRVNNPIQLQGLQKKAEIEAIKRNLDIYYDMEDKPSNIEQYQTELEEKYKNALVDYKEFINLNNISDKTLSANISSIEGLINNRQKTLNNEVVQNDLRGHLNNLFTKQGALDYINKTDEAAKSKDKKKFDIKDATTEEYIAHEKSKEAKERLKYRTNTIERETFDKDLESRLKTESIDAVLEDVNTHNPKLTKKGAKIIDDLSSEKASQIEADKQEAFELDEKSKNALWDDEVEFTSEDENRLNELQAKDNTRFEKAHEEYKSKSKRYLEEIPEATDNRIKRRIKESFLKGATAVRDHAAKNSEYSKDKEVQNEIDKLENLKKIYESRDEELRNSEEFKGLTEMLDENIAALQEIKKDVEKRLADRDARDKRIPGNQATIVLTQVGLNTDGTVIEGKEEINTNIRNIIGEDVYQGILTEANGNLTRIHGDIIIQLVKDSSKDKTELEDAIAKAKDETFYALFDLPRVNQFLALYKEDGSPAEHHNGNVVNAYYKNPSTTFSAVIDVIRDNQGTNPFDDNKSSAVYKFLKDLDLIEFITNAEQPRDGSVISSEELIKIIEGHNAYNSLFELEKSLKSSSNIHVELSRELDQEKKFATTGEVRTPTPSNQQTVSIRQLIRFLKTPFKGTERFDGFAYMKGAAGTGKSNLVMRWVYKLSGLSKDSIYTAGHNVDSGATIAKSLGKNESNTVEDAIATIPTLSEDIKLIVLDEAPGVSQDTITQFADTVAEANKNRKNKLRVIMLGDPNQVTANGSYSSIDDAVSIKGADRITQISPLTIRYRSDVAPIVDFQDLFIDQKEDLTKSPIHVKSNVDNPSSFSSSNVDLLGVNGARKDFDSEMLEILKARKDKNDGRTRAIIVNDEAEVQKYKDLLATNGINNVDVYTFVSAQGKTIDEVYQNVKNNKSFKDMKAYNTALYTASSRATKYLFVGGLPIENSVSDTIEEIANDRAEQNKKRSDKFIKERENELDTTEKFITEIANEKSLETEVDEEEAETLDEEVDTEIEIKEVVGDEEIIEEIEEPVDETYDESFTEPEVKLLTNDSDDMSDAEGNSQINSDYENVPESSHVIQYPVSKVIAPIKKDGSYGKGVKAGDKVLYVLRKVGDKKQVVMVTPVSGNDYAEIGVLSTDELLNPPIGFEESYAKLLNAVNNPDATFEEFRYEKDKVFTIPDIQELLEGTIEHAQKLAYVYNKNPKSLVIENMVEKFLATFYPLGNLANRKAVKSTIKIFTHKEIEDLENPRKRKFELPFSPLAGMPYLMIEGLNQKGNEEGQSKVQLIRLSPAKLNFKTHGKYVTPILDFINKTVEVHNALDNVEGGDRIRLGSKEFAEIVKAKPKKRLELIEKYGINTEQYLANETQFNKLFSQLDNIVYEHKEEILKDSEKKKILVNYTVEFDTAEGKEENKFEDRAKVKSIKDKVATLSNGLQIPVSDLIRVPVVKRFDGDAQKALTEISYSNPLIEGKIIRTFFDKKERDKQGNVIGIKREKGTVSLLSERGGLSLEDLETMFAFDSETGESIVNNGFGIRVPISKKDFPSDGKQSADIRPEDYLLDTFDGVKATSLSVSLKNSARKERDTLTIVSETPITEEEKDAEAQRIVDEMEEEQNLFFMRKETAQESTLGVKITNDSVYNTVKKVLPNLSKDEVKIVSEAQMLAITDGVEAWGFFKKGIIYLLEGVVGIGEKVIMHEAFHKIFAENFTKAERSKLIGAARRENPALRTVSNEKVEEYLAEKFQNWKSKQGRVSLALVNFFKKVLHILGLYQTNFSNIEQVMADIDSGLLGTKKGEVAYEGRAMLKIREDYLSTEHFRRATFEVTSTMSKLINASKPTKDGIVKIDLNKNHANLKEAFSMEFDEAIKELGNIIELRKKAIERTLLDKNLDENKLKNTTFNKEVYDILSNEKTRKELLNAIYPSIYTGSSEFTEITEDIIPEIYNTDQKGISDDAMDADMINHERSIGPLVKDLLATIVYVEAGKLKIVNPRFAFVKLLQAFDNVNTLNLDNMSSQIKSQLAANGNPSVEAISKRIEDLIFDSKRTVYNSAELNEDGKPIRKKLTKGVEFADTNKFTYNNGKSVIYKRGKSTEDFVRGIYSKLQNEGMDISMEELKGHYDKMKSRTTLAAIRTSIGSLRKKNIMVGVKVFENVEKDPLTGKTLRDENGKPVVHYSTHYRYNSVRDKGTVQTVRNEVENALINNYSNITSEFNSKFKKAKNDEDKIELINEFLDLVHIPFEGGIPEEVLTKTFNDVRGFSEAAFAVGDKISIEKVIEESNERIKSITNVISKNNETLKSVSYTAADGTKRYEWLHSSYGIDVFKYLASGTKRRAENIKNFPFINSPIFKGNPFLNDETNKISNRIHRYVDHDGIKDKDGKYPAITYKGETTADWFSRTINLGFASMLENRAEDTDGKKRYVQYAYTISNKPNIIGNEVDLKSDNEIKEFINAALEQQRNRPDFDIKNYNKDKNFFKGNTTKEVYESLEVIADELTQQLIDSKFVPDYKISQLQQSLTKQLSNKFVEDGKIKEGYGLEGITKVKRDNYTLTKEQLLPIIDLFVKNYYMNGYFMNQLMMGDQAFFKSTADQIKRMSIGYSMGTTGMVNEEAGFMDEHFNVAVSDDIESTVGEQFSRFKKFYGISFERTDAAAFMTPERYENIVRGFSPEMHLGYTQKPVYYGIDKNGIPRAMKYSIIVLSDELCNQHEELALLRDQMRNTKGENGKPVGEYVFVSGFKIGAPNKRTEHFEGKGERGWTGEDGKWNKGIRPESIVEMDNRNWRIQLNPVHDVNGTISNPTQLTYFANFNGTNKAFADKLYDLNSLLINRGLDKVNEKLGKDGGTAAKIRNAATSTLGNTEARLYEFLTSKDENGKHMISINFPVAVNKVVTQIGATISKATVKIKYPGSKLVLQPDYGVKFKDKDGVKRGLRFREKYTNEKGETFEYMEVILPNMYKDQFKHGDFLFESYMGFRIPSTELHSSVPIKVVGFYDSKGTNVVIAPGEITAAHGSDYDIDALFIMRRESYTKDDVENLLFKGQIIGYSKDGKKIENFYLKLQKRIAELHREIEATKDKDKRAYLRSIHKQLDKAFDAALKNEVLDTFLEIITHPENADTMMTPISMARLNGKENSVVSEFKSLGITTDNNFDLNDPRDQAQIHKDNFAGSILTATLADNVRGLAYALQSLKEGTEATIQEKAIIEIDDVPYNKLSREEIYTEEDTKAGKNLDKDGKPYKVSETLDALINAALDNVKEQILSIINLSNNTAESFIAMIAMGIPLNTVSKYMITPLIKEVSDSRKYKDGVLGATVKINSILTDLFMTGEGAITQEELNTLIENKKVTVDELNILVKTSANSLTKELALLQYKVLKDFVKAQKVGAEINEMTKATKVLKELPVTQEEIVDKIELFEKLKTKTNPIISGVNIMRIPHVAAAHQALLKLNLVVNNNFYKHRTETNELAKDISNQLGIRLDFNKNKNLRMIRDEISKFVLSSISYNVDDIVHDFSTSEEEPYSYKNFRDVDKDAVGTDAFNQRFIDDVIVLKETYPDNKFLKGLSISKDFTTGMNRLVYNDANNLEPAEIIDIQDDFKKFMVNGKYTKEQRDFVKYAVLNYGLTFGTTNYTLLLPVDIYKEVSSAMDNMFEFMLNKRNTETTVRRLKNISQFIFIQMGVNEIESLTQNKDFVANGKYPAYGVDETPTGKVKYDMKFTLDKQGIVVDEEMTEEVENTTVEQESESTDGVKSSEVQLSKGKKLKLPTMMKLYDKAYIRLAQNDGDTHIYYREVSRKKYSKYYRSSQKRLTQLMMYGYSIADMFKRDATTRSVLKPITEKYSTKVTENSNIFEIGEYITLKAYDDIAQVDAFEYRVSGITFFGEDDNIVDKEQAVRVEYDLTNPKQVLILDDSRLSNEDKKDLENFC